MKNLYIILFAFFILFSACNKNNKNKNQNSADYKTLNKTLEKVNKQLVASEDEQIESFIKRYNWKMKKTGTGLRYLIYKHGKGEKAEKGRIAKINYRVNLLNGDLCYSSKDKGPKEFVIGKGNVESGLEQGILLLKVGDKAKFILPSHLAFGLIGDQDKIPAKAALVYDIELLELK